MRLTRFHARGFSLIELLAAVAIVALIAMIALPSYRTSVLKSRRVDAQVALNDLAQRLERCYTQFGAYDTADCAIVAPYASAQGFYSVSLARTASSYGLTATPTGDQAADARCTQFSLNELGQKNASGTHPVECW
jgi:type IV pilus assembly protein PilE